MNVAHVAGRPVPADLPDRVTFRLGELKGPLQELLAETGQTPSDFMREILAEALGEKAPEMKPGNPAIGEQAAKGGRAKAKKPGW